MPQPLTKVKGTNVFRLPALQGIGGLACAWVGRDATPRPDPVQLLPLVAAWPADIPPLATVSQIHSNRWIAARAPILPPRIVLGEADAIATSDSCLALGVATADCLPIAAVDPEGPALAVVHAGWRGTIAGVLRETLMGMAKEMGARPERMTIGVGPAVGVCCYRVGEDVASAFEASWPGRGVVLRSEDGAARLDLLQANRIQAEEAGLPPWRFHALGICTVCRSDLCHSYRREGPAAGRMWLIASLL